MCSFERGEMLLRPWRGPFDALPGAGRPLWGGSDDARTLPPLLDFVVGWVCNRAVILANL